ncbi:putative RING-H2 finger protein ATL21A [Chenopodium quinoa]|uniref:RING-type domain-containing protein n=1 Tax=Chenopodium quinoa TaxID=63459 RepID=A0A803L2N9_CHEQI|nr:putative RING-H2 finger protein ATL21A [Chenopodium quinoa]
MQILKKPIFFLLSFLFLISTKSMENNTNLSDLCLIQVCSYRKPVNRYVQFPFLLSNESLPTSCGYPGFDLSCNKDYELQINLPNSGVFSVQEIDYVHQELWLNDPDNCLPKRLLSLNNASNFVGNNSPFSPVLEQDYWFFNCSNDFFNSSDDHQSKPIECLSGQSYGVFATPLENIVKGNSSLCVKIGPIRVPVRKRSNKSMYSSSELKDDIMLTWAQPHECRECYKRDGNCRFKSNSSLEVGCFNLPRRGFSRGAMIVIALAFATPLVLVTICITYYYIKAVCLRRRATNARLTSLILTSTVTPQPQHVIHGLDQSIIESYPKVVLGESRRLPKPDEKCCPICLGEYLAKDILRTIPDCRHCFHADCIDEWLLLNASCPVCRYSPSQIPENNA